MCALTPNTSPRLYQRYAGVVVFFLFAAWVGAQTIPTRWRWSNPGPHGADVYDIAYGKGLTVQVGERGQIFASENLDYWEPKRSGTTKSLRAVRFFGNRLVVTGEAGTVLYADSLEDFQVGTINATTDWLESVAASATTLVAVGDNGAIYTSTDGAAWTRETSGTTTWLRGVAFGGGTFVAVGENGYIATATTTGKAWTSRASGTSAHLNRVAYINNTFCVVGDNGVVLKSSNGTTWSTVGGVGAANDLISVSGTNSMSLLAGDHELRLSLNGTTWSNELNPAKVLPAPDWTYYAGVCEGTLFLISGRSGMTVEGFTTNSTDYIWVTRHDSIRSWLWEALRLPEFYVAVGDRGTIVSSAKGVDWDLELTPDGATNSVLLGVGGTTNGLVAVGNKGTIVYSANTLTSVVITNSDDTKVTNQVSTVGTIWQAVDPKPVATDLQGIAWTNGLFVTSGAAGVILTSANGTEWHPQNSTVTKYLSSVAAFPGGYVASGNTGTLLSSPDGTNWTVRAAEQTTNWLFRVRYVNGILVAVGEKGAIFTSTDGQTWTSRTSGTTNWLNDVTYVQNTYYAAGTRGTVLASADAITWTNIGTITQKALYGLAHTDSQLIAVGVEGAIVRTQLAPIMEPVKFLDFGVASDQQAFLISAVPDLRFRLESTTNWVDWEQGVTFEMLDPSGSLLFRQKAPATPLPREMFRAVTIP